MGSFRLEPGDIKSVKASVDPKTGELKLVIELDTRGMSPEKTAFFLHRSAETASPRKVAKT